MQKDGIIINVKVMPNAVRDEVVSWENDCLKIKITATPEKGEANRALIRLISKSFQIPQRDIILVKGEKNRLKKILLSKLSFQEFELKLKEIINGYTNLC